MNESATTDSDAATTPHGHERPAGPGATAEASADFHRRGWAAYRRGEQPAPILDRVVVAAINALPRDGDRKAAERRILAAWSDGWSAARDAGEPRTDPPEPPPPVTVRLSFTAAEGVLLDAPRGGPAQQVLDASAQQWRWWRDGDCWYVLHSGDRAPRLQELRRDATALEAAGFVVEVDIDARPRSQAEAEAARAAHMVERAETLAERAERLRRRGEADYAAATQTRARIPLGQPVMPDHHSYARDIRHRRRIDAQERRGLDAIAAGDAAATRANYAATYMAHRENPYLTARRLKDKRAERARIDRALTGYTRNHLDGNGAVRYREEHPPATGPHREQLLLDAAFLDEEIAYWEGVLAAATAAGTYFEVDPAELRPGRLVKINNSWYPLVKAHKVNVKVRTPSGSVQPFPINQLRGVRDPETPPTAAPAPAEEPAEESAAALAGHRAATG